MDYFKVIVELFQIATGIGATYGIFLNYNSAKNKNKENKKEVAKNVSCWIRLRSKQGKYCVINNNNNLPIYKVYLILYSNNSNIDPIDVDSKSIDTFHYEEILPPGKFNFSYTDYPAAGNEHLVPTIYFTDNNNTQWIRKKNGRLEIYKSNYIEKLSKQGKLLKHV